MGLLQTAGGPGPTRRACAVLAAALAIVCGVSIDAGGNVPKTLRTPVGDGPFSAPGVSARLEAPSHLSTAMLRVENVLLEAAVRPETEASTLLTFEVINGAPTPLTDLVLEVSVDERRDSGAPVTGALVRPFTIRGHTVLDAGYTMKYEMLLRNLPASCDCVATVGVISVRWLIDRGL